MPMWVNRMQDVVKFQELPFVLTIEEAAKLLGISRGAAYQAARSGEIPTNRIGRRLIVPTARLLSSLGIQPERPAGTVTA